MPSTIRAYLLEDATVTALLFYETVRNTAGSGYEDAQRAAWAPGIPEPGPWHSRLSSAVTLVAEDDTGVTGFMSLKHDGYLDLAFVRTDRVGSGVAKMLYDMLLQRAREAGLKHLTADASFMSRRFFERQGWHLVSEQRQVRLGVVLANFRMAIDLE